MPRGESATGVASATNRFELAAPGPEASPAAPCERTFDFHPPEPKPVERAAVEAAPFELQPPAPESDSSPFEFLPPDSAAATLAECATEELARPIAPVAAAPSPPDAEATAASPEREGEGAAGGAPSPAEEAVGPAERIEEQGREPGEAAGTREMRGAELEPAGLRDGLAAALQEMADAEPAPVAPPASSQEAADSLQGAVSRFAGDAASAEFPSPLPPDLAARCLAKAPPARLYRLRQVAALLGASLACAVFADSEGLLSWARRMDVGPVQSGWLAVLSPIHRGLDRVGVTAPRALLVEGAEKVGRLLGTGEDPLFAAAWRSAEAAGAEEANAPAAPANETPVPVEEANAVPSVPAQEIAVPKVAAEASAEAEAPAPGQERAVATQETTVLLVGDSMMAGNLAASITRELERRGPVRVVRAVQMGTGLARPDLFDWQQVIGALIEREKPSFVVCSLGANDVQRIRLGDRQLSFGEAAWNAAYRQRVVAMMQAMSANGAQVLWLGLPPMRDRFFSSRVDLLNRLFAQASKRVPRVEYLELEMLVSGRDGEYASFTAGRAGRLARLRMEDGIHYAPGGARVIAHWVVDWVRERMRRSPQMASGG